MNSLKKILLSTTNFMFLGLFLSSKIVFAQTQLDDSIKSIVKEYNLAGASVVVIKDGRNAFSGNFGFADLDNKVAVSDETAFSIMSLSKNIVACSVMQLVEQNKISLNDPITKYLTNLPADYAQVKIFELLDHSSGVPDYVHVKDYMKNARRSQTPWELLKPILNNGLQFVPGEKNDYSNSNYILLGLLIENVAKTSLSNYLKSNIFKPLGMEHTYLETNSDANRKKAKGYAVQKDKIVYQPPLNPTQYWAAGGIVSTAHDLALYHLALLSGRLLPLSNVKEMMRGRKLQNGSNSEYGFGFELMQGPDLEIAGNTGVGVGYNAAYLDFIKDGVTIIALTNTTNGKSAMIAKQIHDLLALQAKPAKTAAPLDRLDEIVLKVMKNSVQGSPDGSDFLNAEIFQKFKNDVMPFIQQQGQLKTIEQKGEKINPENIIRRYQVKFVNNQTAWVIAFSKNGKIMMVNHM